MSEKFRRFFFYVTAFSSRFVLFPIYFFSGFVPRRHDLWVFGSWGGYRYADNAAAFFRYCRETLDDDTQLVWISRRREIVHRLRAQGFEAYLLWSPRGIRSCLRAGVYLFDCFAKDINFWLSRGALLVNLWSGVPLKTFERDIDNPANRYYRLFHGPAPERFLYSMMMPWHVVRPDLIIATSEETARITCRAFNVDESRVAVTGFPRNDGIVAPQSPSAVGDELPESFARALAAGQRIILYLPTFRDSGKPYLRLDWERLANRIEEDNATFFCKSHPVDRGHFGSGHAQIIELGQDVDVYALLPHTDMLISDYSSIIFDFMLLNRPIIYWTPDLDEFVSENRALNFDPLEIAVGRVCRTFDELLDAIGRNSWHMDEARRNAVFTRLHSYADAEASARVLRAVRALIEGNSSAMSDYKRTNAAL